MSRSRKPGSLPKLRAKKSPGELALLRRAAQISSEGHRAAMLVPTIAVLAPVMLLFIAAPLPSIVFGSR